jgi:hypothetical protein
MVSPSSTGHAIPGIQLIGYAHAHQERAADQRQKQVRANPFARIRCLL